MYICYLDEAEDFFGVFKVHQRMFEIESHIFFWKKERCGIDILVMSIVVLHAMRHSQHCHVRE